MALPNNVVFGKHQKHNLIGACALIGGSKQHLLFITRESNEIDVIELQSWEYLKTIKNTTLPIAKNNYIGSHCLVSINNSKNNNEFCFMARGETLLIRYDEEHKEFSYRQISAPLASFQFYTNYAYAYWNRRMFIFGGVDAKRDKPMDSIWILDIHKKDTIWKKSELKMPSAIGDATAVLSESDSSAHIIGGNDDKGKDQSTHYVMNLLTLQDIETIAKYWIRTQEKELTKGWIGEFNKIIANYINIYNSGYRRKRKRLESI